MAKTLNFLSDQVSIADVHRMFAERKAHHICTVTQKKLHYLNNNMTNSSSVLEVFVASFRAFFVRMKAGNGDFK